MDSDILQQLIHESGVDLKVAGAEVVKYMRARAAHLATLVNDPDYGAAVRAEAKNVFSYAAEKTVDQADLADVRLWNLILGFLVV